MSIESNDRLLRWTLRANAAFSLVCAVPALIDATPLARTLGVPDPGLLVLLGGQLLIWAGLLLWLTSRPVIGTGLALAVVTADALWVLGTVPVVLLGDLTRTGVWTALVVADVVATFAVLQLVGIRRARGGLRLRTA